MRIAILANDRMSYVRPMAEGLARMFRELGEQPTVLYDGWGYLNPRTSLSRRSRMFVRNARSRLANAALGTEHVIQRRRKVIEDELRSSDLVVVVAHIPNAYMRKMHRGIEACREWLDVPIVLYDLIHPTAQDPWLSNLLDGYLGGGFGLERYDWYLFASVVSERALPRDFRAWSLVGMDLRDGSLSPMKNEGFLAVLDFPRPGYEHQRDIQAQALKDVGIPFISLERRLSIDEIRSIYRKTCLFFLSFPESFGLPIVEVQLCGGYICTPYESWVPSHYIGKDIYESGPGSLSGNFIVYDNDMRWLKRRLETVRATYDPDTVVQEFRRSHPHLYQGDRDALRSFTDTLRSGEVTHQSHLEYSKYNSAMENCRMRQDL